MADAIRVSGTLTGTDKTLSFETGKLAQQSQGAVVASLGRTTVLATANPGCHLQIARGLRQAGSPITLLQPVTLLARAYRAEVKMKDGR